MKKELSYKQAYAKLEELVGQLEDGDIQLEELAEKVKQANALIEICEVKLRKIDAEVKDALAVVPRGKKK